jgi:hypothetical protein
MILQDSLKEQMKLLAYMLKHVATECHIPFIDLWTKMQQFPDWKKFI